MLNGRISSHRPYPVGCEQRGQGNQKSQAGASKAPGEAGSPMAAEEKPVVLQTTMLGDPVEPMEPERMIPEPMIPESMAVPQPERSGSLPGKSMEGVDPCHPQAERKPARRMEHRLRAHPEAREMYPQEEHEGLVPELTPENMRQAFVMSEILTRPCERRRYP